MLETGIDESEAQIQSDSLLEGSKYISESDEMERREVIVSMLMRMKLTMMRQTILSMTSQTRGRMMMKMKNKDNFILRFFRYNNYLKHIF